MTSTDAACITYIVRTAMTNGHGIETPASKIATAQATLCLALRLSGEVAAGRITAEIFKRGITVHTGGDGLELSPSPKKPIRI